jgi:hypothetical protein
LRGEIVRDIQFLDDDNWIKTTIGLTDFVLKAMTLGAGLTKR